MSSRNLARLSPLVALLPLPTDTSKTYLFKPDSGFTEYVAPIAVPPVVVDATAARTLGLADSSQYIRYTSTGSVVLTVPANATLAIPIGSEFHGRRVGTANLTITPASGVTINAPSGGSLVATARMTWTLKKVGADEWDLLGQTVAA